MISFKIERDGAEYHIWCPELHGCHSHATTVKQAVENIKDAVKLYLDDVIEETLLNDLEEMAA